MFIHRAAGWLHRLAMVLGIGAICAMLIVFVAAWVYVEAPERLTQTLRTQPREEWRSTPPGRTTSAPRLIGEYDETTPYLVKRGRYLARAADCVTCHTRPGGEPYAGGRSFQTKFGTIYSSNITPDVATGIGNYTSGDLWRVMHHGIKRDGEPLYPAMPYPSFTKIPRRDVNAIYAYLMSLEPVESDIPRNELMWPLGWRQLMRGWNLLFFEAGVYEPDESQSAAWNRGAYLVEALGHCGGCHTPRNFFMALKEDKSLQGGRFETWYAPNLARGLDTGVDGGWTVDDLVLLFQTGLTRKGAAVGAMANVVGHSLRFLNEQDLRAIAIYLKSVPPTEVKPNKRDRTDERAAGPGVVETATVPTGENADIGPGRMVYLHNCNACHKPDGMGVPDTFPPLAGNGVVETEDPTTAIHIVLAGARLPYSPQRPSQFTMPDFGWRLTDRQIAEVLTFIRSSWGNDASPVSPREVAELRGRVVPIRRVPPGPPPRSAK